MPKPTKPRGAIEDINAEIHTVETVGPIMWIKQLREASVIPMTGEYISLGQAKQMVDNLRARGYRLVQIIDEVGTNKDDD